MRAWEFAKSPGFLPPCWDWAWANTLAPGSSLALGLGPRTHFKGKAVLLLESYAANGSVTGLKKHKWHWILTWFGQFLWLGFFPHGISLAPQRPRALSWPSLPRTFVYMEARINLRQNIHLFAKNWNEYQKSMICHCSRIPRRLTGYNLKKVHDDI